MRLSIVSDEISRNFAEAIEFGLEWGIRDFEVRHLQSGRAPFISHDEIRSLIKIKEQRGVEISAISSGLFQISLRDEEQIKLQIEDHIYESFRFAEKLETRNVIIFGFKRYSKEPQTNYIQVVHILGRMAALAERYGFNLLLENYPSTWADTGANTAMILDDVNSKNLMANWDPANARWSGEIPYPYGYLAIRKHVFSIHVKDLRERKNHEPEIVVVGEGDIDWGGQLRAVLTESITRYITIETHCKPLIENSQRNLLSIMDLLENIELDEKLIIK
ncbi:MAG: sugar phosphate isomerase/epimerase [bacterium]|nr:sugar phosphate isomerase/epimerase [bacterium]